MPQPNPPCHRIEELEGQGAQARKEAKYAYTQAFITLRVQRDSPNDLGVAHMLTILGELAQTRPHFEDAKEYYQRALDICKHSLGPKHPHTIQCLGDVASNYDLAEPLYRKAATLSEPVSGRWMSSHL